MDFRELSGRIQGLEERVTGIEIDKVYSDATNGRWDMGAEKELAKSINEIEASERDLKNQIEELKEEVRVLQMRSGKSKPFMGMYNGTDLSLTETAATTAAQNDLAQAHAAKSLDQTLKAIATARDAALLAIVTAQNQTQTQPPTPYTSDSSLKRKRSVDEGIGAQAQPSEGSQSNPGTQPVVEAEEQERPLKRARGANAARAAVKVANAVVQTAGAVALGGVVTWGVLAFT
jgi:hypothetical protein